MIIRMKDNIHTMEIIILIISAFITSSISAVLGMGGGIILLGIMAIMIPNGYMVIALHGIIQLISNTTRTYVFRKYLKKDLIRNEHWRRRWSPRRLLIKR